MLDSLSHDLGYPFMVFYWSAKKLSPFYKVCALSILTLIRIKYNFKARTRERRRTKPVFDNDK